MQSFEKDKIVWDLEICKNIDLLKSAFNIMIYGAGYKGKDIFCKLERAGIHTSFFIDQDMDKWGRYIENVKVISPFEIKYTKFDDNGYIYIIVCIENPKDVVNLFKCMQLDNVRIITFWGIKMALYLNREYLYRRDLMATTMFSIENERRRNRFLDGDFSFMYSLVASTENAIWILQPGKTASSTLERRLEKKLISYIKIHKLEYQQQLMGNKYKKIWEESIKKRKEKPLKVIVAVREPIARDYSAFWQPFSEGNEKALEVLFLNKDFQKTYDEYIDILLNGNMYIKSKPDISIIYSWGDEFEWFDEQIKQYLDIDVFQYPFDKEKGYCIIEKGNIELLLYKVEKMEYILGEIASFVGTKELPMINDNVGKKKWYGLAYDQFRKEVKIPKRYVDHYYCGNAKMDHFYTLKEKEEFLNKWKENITID